MDKTRVVSTHDPDALTQAAEILRRGGLVAFPTDTVYGLGCLTSLPSSVKQLYLVKKRQRTKAIPILVPGLKELNYVAVGVGINAHRLAERFWPGPLTLILPRNPDVPEIISPGPTIGVRMPNHPVTLALLQLTGPLAVTSANLSGWKNPSTAKEVLEQLGGRIPLIIDGGHTPGGEPSTVVDCVGQELNILRTGPISLEELQAVLA